VKIILRMVSGLTSLAMLSVWGVGFIGFRNKTSARVLLVRYN